MNGMQLVRGAIGVILRGDDRFLVIERSEFVRAPGRLCFPGGGIETGESEQDAVRRELKEELELDVVPIRRVWRSRSRTQVELSWWLTKLSSVEQVPQPNTSEVAAYDWMSHDEMIASPGLLESNRLFLRAIEVGEVHL